MFQIYVLKLVLIYYLIKMYVEISIIFVCKKDIITVVKVVSGLFFRSNMTAYNSTLKIFSYCSQIMGNGTVYQPMKVYSRPENTCALKYQVLTPTLLCFIIIYH